MSKVALITGITGQDGSYLAELLLSKGYEVHGIVRRVALEDEMHRLWRIRKILKNVSLHSASLESYASIFKILQKIKPNEVYHLAAQSYVAYSFEDEFSTFNSNINGTHYMLSAVREFSNKTKPRNFIYSIGIDLLKRSFSINNNYLTNTRNVLIKKLDNNNMAKNFLFKLADKGFFFKI